MEISNLFNNYIRQSLAKEVLAENTIFQGEIIDIQGDIIFLEIPGKGVIQAESKLDLEQLLGESIEFLVESKTASKIEIKPLIEEALSQLASETDASISKVLKEFNIKETDLSKDLIKNLMKYEVPLKAETLNEAVKTLDKLIQLSELEDEGLIFIDKEGLVKENQEVVKPQSIELASNEVLLEESDASDRLAFNKESSGEPINKDELIEKESMTDKDFITSRDLKQVLEDLPDIKKELLSDIKNILISSKSNEDEKELGKWVKELLKDFDIESNEKEFLDIVSFLTKNKLKPSINNIRNLKELMDDPLEFAREFKVLEDDKSLKELSFVKKNGEIVLEEIQDEDKDITSKNIDGKDLEKMELKNKTGNKLDLTRLKEKTEFIKDLNREIYFHFVPINYGRENLNGLINIIKERKKKKTSDDSINIFISLDTHNLGNVSISCQAKQDNLKIKVGIKEKDLSLFKAGKDLLISKIQMLGYNISDIDFIVGKKIDINEELMSNTDPMHFLDIKV